MALSLPALFGVSVLQITNGFFFASSPYEFTRPVFPEVSGVTPAIAASTSNETVSTRDAVSYALTNGAGYFGDVRYRYKAFSASPLRHENLWWLAEAACERYAPWYTAFSDFQEIPMDTYLLAPEYDTVRKPKRPETYLDPYNAFDEWLSAYDSELREDYAYSTTPMIYAGYFYQLFSLIGSGQTNLDPYYTQIGLTIPIEGYYGRFSGITNMADHALGKMTSLEGLPDFIDRAILATPFRPNLSNFHTNLQVAAESLSELYTLSSEFFSPGSRFCDATNYSAFAEEWFYKSVGGWGSEAIVTNLENHARAREYGYLASSAWEEVAQQAYEIRTILNPLFGMPSLFSDAKKELYGYLFACNGPLAYTRSPTYFKSWDDMKTLSEMAQSITNYFTPQLSLYDFVDVSSGVLKHWPSYDYEDCTNAISFISRVTGASNGTHSIARPWPPLPRKHSSVTPHFLDDFAYNLSKSKNVTILLPFEKFGDYMITTGTLARLQTEIKDYDVTSIYIQDTGAGDPAPATGVFHTPHIIGQGDDRHTYSVWICLDGEYPTVSTNYLSDVDTATPERPLSLFDRHITVQKNDRRAVYWLVSRRYQAMELALIEPRTQAPVRTNRDVSDRWDDFYKDLERNDPFATVFAFTTFSYSALTLGKPLHVHSPVVIHDAHVHNFPLTLEIVGFYYICRDNTYELPVSRGSGLDGEVFTDEKSSSFMTALCDVNFSFSVDMVGWGDQYADGSYSNRSYSAYNRRTVVPIVLPTSNKPVDHQRFDFVMATIYKAVEEALLDRLCEKNGFAFERDPAYKPPWLTYDTPEEQGYYGTVAVIPFEATRSVNLDFRINGIAFAVNLDFTQGVQNEKEKVYHVPGYRRFPKVPDPNLVGEDGWFVVADYLDEHGEPVRVLGDVIGWAADVYLKGSLEIGNKLQYDLYEYESGSFKYFFDWMAETNINSQATSQSQ